MNPVLRVLALVSLLLGPGLAAAAPRACLSECTPRIGIVSAFGEEAAILVREQLGEAVTVDVGHEGESRGRDGRESTAPGRIERGHRRVGQIDSGW